MKNPVQNVTEQGFYSLDWTTLFVRMMSVLFSRKWLGIVIGSIYILYHNVLYQSIGFGIYKQYYRRSGSNGTLKCKLSMNFLIFLSHFSDFHGCKVRGYCSRSRTAPIPLMVRGNCTEPKAQIDFAPQGANQTQQARYLRITISQKLNAPTHCLQEGHPLNPDMKGEDRNSRDRTA